MSDSYDLTFVWPYAQAHDVIVTGTFDQWTCSFHLMRTQTGFEGHVSVPWNSKVLYKFVVDGRWSTLDSKPTEIDSRGNVNNVTYTPEKPAPPPMVAALVDEEKTAEEKSSGPDSVESLVVQSESPVKSDLPLEESNDAAKASHADDDEDAIFQSAASHFDSLHTSAVNGNSPPLSKAEHQYEQYVAAISVSVDTQTDSDLNAPLASSEANHPEDDEAVSPAIITQSTTDTSQKPSSETEPTNTNHTALIEARQEPVPENEDTKYKDVPVQVVTTRHAATDLPSPIRTELSDAPSQANGLSGRTSDVTVVETGNPGTVSKGVSRKPSFIKRLKSMLHLPKNKRTSRLMGSIKAHAK